jgi:anthranilate phosphoribosyltransferase
VIVAREALRRWMNRESLTRAETEALFGELMDGVLSDVVKAALLAALAAKGETAAEITGAAAALRRRVVRIPHAVPGVVDTCGTGGDGSGTFNISTAAAFVAAAAGVPIAKHGNRSVSSRSGSADVLAALGADIETTPEGAARCLQEVGIAFLFAPRLHPAMKEVMPVRRELGVRTVFNILGPLANPAGARRQVLGVYADGLVEPIARVLAELGAEHALVVHGRDGLDEITCTGATRVAEVRAGAVTLWEITPEQLGIRRCAGSDLLGGTPEENAVLLRRTVEGEAGPLADVTAINAGAAIYVGGRERDLAGGVGLARQVLRSGAAGRKLDEFLAFREAE